MFVIEGRGYGHGVGMSQYGAEGFAARGADYREVLTHYYPGTKLAQAPDTARVRVLLVAGTGSVVVGSVDPVGVIDGQGNRATLRPGNYRVDGSLVFRDGHRFVRAAPPVRLSRGRSPLTLNGHAYRGSFVLRPATGGVMVVNEVAVDDYVRGVIAWEMPASWHREALRAQAVAARSYALASLTPSRLFDVYPDTRSQMYGGLSAERVASDRAVLTTLREVLVWDGRVASTYFSSSSGGKTAAASDVWPSGRRLPYLVSVPDPYDSRSPLHHWGPYLLSAETLASRLGVAQVEDVRMTSERSGRVASVQIMTEGRTVSISGSTVARALGLRSTWFSIHAPGTPGLSRVQERRTASQARHALSPPPPVRPNPSRGLSPPALESPRRGHRRVLIVILAALLGLLAIRRRHPRGARAAELALVATAAAAITVALRPETHAAHRATAAHLPTGGLAERAPTVRARKPPAPLSEAPTPRLPALPREPAPSGDLEWQTLADTPAPRARRTAEPDLTTTAAVALPATPAWAQTTADPVAPPAPLAISDVSVASVSASTIVVKWRTNLPAITQGARGLALSPRVWTEPQLEATEHETTLGGLGENTAYRIWLLAQDEFGQTASTQLLIPTTDADETTETTTAGHAILVNDEPTFPVMLWAICASEVGPKLELGIDVFMGNSCGSAGDLLRRLDGRALAVVDPREMLPDAQGVLGWYYPDEWDASLPSSVKLEQLHAAAQPATDAGLSFLTLTNHFYSRASALPQGKGMYPALLSLPDVIGFDLYPLQTWCRPAFADVFDAQAELHAASAGKPTFQWIEVAPMEHICNTFTELNPTPETVRAETWLAIAGGASGIGYFPNNWAPELDATIAQANWQIRELAPALLAPPTDARTDTSAIKLSARRLNNAVYVIAVNTTTETLEADLHVLGLDGRSAEVVGEDRSVTANDDTIRDEFGPLGVHVYIVPPAPWMANLFTEDDEPSTAGDPASSDRDSAVASSRW
jgi:stage II sporulation protein D